MVLIIPCNPPCHMRQSQTEFWALITKKHLTIILGYDNDLPLRYVKVKMS